MSAARQVRPDLPSAAYGFEQREGQAGSTFRAALRDELEETVTPATVADVDGGCPASQLAWSPVPLTGKGTTAVASHALHSKC